MLRTDDAPEALRVLAIGSVYPPHYLGGYEVIWQGAMRHARRQGHAVRLLTTDYRRADLAAEAREDPEVYRELGWYWRDHEWPAMSARMRLALERRNARIFDRHVRDFRPDVLTWWPVGGMSLSLIERGRRAALPALLFLLDYWPTYGPERDLWMRAWLSRPRLATVAERITGVPARFDLGAAGRWLFVSEAVRHETFKTGLQIEDWKILPAGIDEGYLNVPREAEPPPWRWRLLYVGRVVDQKGVHVAIESLALLPPSAELTVVGEGDAPYRRSLEALAQRAGVAERVRFEPTRPREEMFEVYRDCDAVVFPVQWEEPWGLVPLEAMALGRPVVATGRGGSGDFLKDGVNSLLFEAADPAALAAAVRSLAGDEALRQRLRTAGYETARRHTETEFNRRVVEEMKDVVTRPIRPRRRP